MKLRVLCLALSLVASACLTNPETGAEFGESPSPSQSGKPLVEDRSSAPTAPAPIRLPAFALHHQDQNQYQVRSTTHSPNSTTVEIFVAKGRSGLLLRRHLEFALDVDGKGFVKGETELPWIFENYETLWVEFPIETTLDSALTLQIAIEEENAELRISRSVPTLPDQIDPLTEPLPHGTQYFGPATFELRSVAFGESSTTAHIFAANQTGLPLGIWFDSRIIDDLGNEYMMMLSSAGEYFSAEATTGVDISASFAGRIHPDATELSLIIDDPFSPLEIKNLRLDMAKKLVPPMPSEGQFEGELTIEPSDLLVRGGAVSFGPNSTAVELEITNSSSPSISGYAEIWLEDDLGNRHVMILSEEIESAGDFQKVEVGTSVSGVYSFAGRVSPNAKRLRLMAKHYWRPPVVVSEITLNRVGQALAPEPVLIRRFSRYVPVSFGESTATSTLLEALAAEVDEGVVQLELPDDVLFEFAKSDLSAEGRAVLADVAELLAGSPESTVSITGHTDGIGTVEANLVLSLDRAESVRRHLVEIHRIDASRLTVDGLGESQPIASEFDASGADSPLGRARNRRTEIRIDGFDE